MVIHRTKNLRILPFIAITAVQAEVIPGTPDFPTLNMMTYGGKNLREALTLTLTLAGVPL
ncbi:hypothetical protein HNR46_000808 [Haloferula luteola]|uniref:Uncharacterized protein n=1 Tax=Haloferula luteola TaxID=595692 RepID=A0A840V9E7_9BACT|nr:hypothetical protein [Haloferula luteola]MBB5350580.1 hypothetical protein [Haloferula luteola]